jgi:hypothetical protein
MNRVRRGALVAGLAVTLGAGAALFAPRAAGAQDVGDRRVLVISAPRLVWQDIVDLAPPALTSLFEESAVASLSIRAIGPRTDIGEGYLTIGAGNRARIDRVVAGDALGAEEVLDGRTGAELYELANGMGPDGAVLHLAAAIARDDADALLYGAEPGAAGRALRESGHATAVIANADGDDGALHREAVLALMDREGAVERGRVDRSLTVEVPAAPTGRVTDLDAVLAAFDAAWVDGAAVLVELSDLERVERAVATAEIAGRPPPDRRALTEAAVARSDELVAGLLERVDLARDLVMVVAPTSPGGRGQLTVFAIAGPEIDPGRARSATTRRDGYVTLPDVGATILDHLGVEIPDAMNATPITSGGGPAYDASVARSLASDDEVARFRDRTVGPISVAYIVTQVVAYSLGAVALSTRRRGLSIGAEVLALSTLAVPLLAFLSGALRVEELGVAGFVVAVLALALVIGVVARLVLRPIHRLAPVCALVAANWALQVADILAGGRLQLDTPFGYSPIVAGRFQGFGNLAFAILASSAIIVAASPPALATPRLPDPDAARQRVRGAPLAVAIFVLGLTVIVDGAPQFGSDVGGVLASVPAFVLVVALLARWRVSWRLVVGGVVATLVAISVFAVVDLSRPEGERTHLGRFVDRLQDGDVGLILRRKLNANWSILTSSVWTWLVPFGLAFLAFLSLRRTGFLRRLQDGVPGVRAALAGCLVVGFLGFALNDSGVAVPAMMFGVVLPWITVGVLASEGPRA